MDNKRLFTKDFIILFIINFFAVMQFFTGIVAIPPYAIEVFHASESIAGLLSGIYVIGALIGRLAGGSVLASYGNRKVLIISSFLFFVATALYLPKLGLTFLLINRTLHGIAYGVLATTTAAVIAQIIPFRRQGEGISHFSLSAIIAMAGGPFMAIILMQHTDFNTMFLCNTTLAAVGLVLSFTKMQQVQAIAKKVQKKSKTSFDIANYIEFGVIPIGCIGMIVALAYSSVLTFISLYAVQLHLEKAAGYYFLICAAVTLFSRPITGRLFDARGANIVFYPSLIALGMGIFLYSQVSQVITLVLSAALFGLGRGNFQSCAQAFAIKISPRHRYGIATATYFVLYEVGLGLGPYFCGQLVQFTGYKNLYLIMGTLVMVDIILYFYLQGRREKDLVTGSGLGR